MRRALVCAAILLVCALYLNGLASMGLVSKDEPRYADIGRAMARSGDWVTPRLSGQPWFEKPALLYWMIALGFEAKLGPELAPRVPVALLSLGFLLFFWYRLRALWDSRVASFSTGLLATSAGWLACSHVAITDLPLAAFFSIAVLLAIGDQKPREIIGASAALGLAVLAKSLVPLILFLPVLAVNYRQLRAWLRPGPIGIFLAVALPWHILCTLRNGSEFPRVLFLKHQFGRFTSPALQHGQPVWYYLPVILLFVYPWFPLFVLIPRDYRDRRMLTLLAVVVFGLIFFSASVNKLATYLLPLLPSLSILLGIGVARRPMPRWIAAASIGLLGALVPAIQVLPTALARGLRSASIPWASLALWMLGAAALGMLVSSLPRFQIVTGVLAAAALLSFRILASPAIDRAVSARAVWLQTQPSCAPSLDRGLAYGLNYYADRLLPECDNVDRTAPRVVR